MPTEPFYVGVNPCAEIFLDGEFGCNFSLPEALSSFGRLRPVDDSERMNRRCARCDEPLLFDPQTMTPRPLLCYACNDDLQAKAESYGGDYGEVYLRKQGFVKEALAKKNVV